MRCRVCNRGRDLQTIADPVIQAERSSPGIWAGQERSFVKLRAEVTSMDVRNDPAAVFESRCDLCRHAIESELLGSSKLDRFVERLAKRELGKRGRDIAARHRLDQSGGYRDLPLCAFLDDCADE